MSKIIGTTYNATNLRAIDLETGTSANLGSRKYIVISAPYKKAFGKPRNEFLCMFPNMWTVEQVWINVLDTATQRTYAVLFIPARVKENSSKQDAFSPTGSVDFIQRAREIAEELEALADADPNFDETCAVAFFAMKKNPDGRTFAGTSFTGGKKQNIVSGIVGACRHGDNCDALADVLVEATCRALSDEVERLSKK